MIALAAIAMPGLPRHALTPAPTCWGGKTLVNQRCPDAPTCPDSFQEGYVRDEGMKGTWSGICPDAPTERLYEYSRARLIGAFSRCQGTYAYTYTHSKSVGACRGVGAALIPKGKSAPTCAPTRWGCRGSRTATASGGQAPRGMGPPAGRPNAGRKTRIFDPVGGFRGWFQHLVTGSFGSVAGAVMA